MIKIKRAYEPAHKDDGYRVLVDRLWPRGLKKSDLVIDEWAKELAPSTELRKSFGHDPDHWETFQAKYKDELLKGTDDVHKKFDELARHAGTETVTLIYAARDRTHNEAVVLKKLLERRPHSKVRRRHKRLIESSIERGPKKVRTNSLD